MRTRWYPAEGVPYRQVNSAPVLALVLDGIAVNSRTRPGTQAGSPTVFFFGR